MGRVEELEAHLRVARLEEILKSEKRNPTMHPDDFEKLKYDLREERLLQRAQRDGLEIVMDAKGRVVAVDPRELR